MRMDRPFVDSRHPTRLGSRFFPSTCILQEGTEASDSVGEQVFTWVDRHEASCRFAEAATVQSPRGQPVTTIFASHRAILVGDFHDVRPDTWRAKIDGVTFDIKAVDWAEGLYTQLELEMQSPTGAPDA